MNLLQPDEMLYRSEMTRLSMPLAALVINLDQDADKLTRVKHLFQEFSFIQLIRSPGFLGSSLPLTVVDTLTGMVGTNRVGTLGCFIAHVMAWETVARSYDWALILEDDVGPTSFRILERLMIPNDAEVIFVNRRASPTTTYHQKAIRFCHTNEWLAYKATPDSRKLPIGGEGYLLSKTGARKLLSAIRVDGFLGHVDWRILRYTLQCEMAVLATKGTWLEKERALWSSNGYCHIQWDLLRGYCMIPDLVRVAIHESSRGKFDRPMRKSS